jgi:hypothetical protein
VNILPPPPRQRYGTARKSVSKLCCYYCGLVQGHLTLPVPHKATKCPSEIGSTGNLRFFVVGRIIQRGIAPQIRLTRARQEERPKLARYDMSLLCGFLGEIPDGTGDLIGRASYFLLSLYILRKLHQVSVHWLIVILYILYLSDPNLYHCLPADAADADAGCRHLHGGRSQKHRAPVVPMPFGIRTPHYSHRLGMRF